jgi:SAM-dependent methyltransferase
MTSPFKKLKNVLAVAPEPFLVTARSRRRVEQLVRSAGGSSTIINIGAGYTRVAPHAINVDIFNSGSTDVIASALDLPFEDGVADLIILQGVLEHVENARKAIEESYRVLKPGGVFYTEMPFLQPYHECPIDVSRSTKPGLARLCLPMAELESGIHIGPASTFAWMLREFLASLISGGRQPLYRRSFTVLGWLVFPLKYADYFLERIPALHTVSSSCYYVGQKK